MDLPTPRLYAPHLAPPGRRPPLGTWLREIRANMLNIVPAAAYRDAVVSDRLGPLRWHVISGAEGFRRVFAENLANYPKAPIMHRVLGPYLGDGLLLARHEDWAWQRRAVASALSGGAVRAMAPAMQRVADRTVARLARRPGEAVPVSFQMRVTAMDMVRHTIFTDLAEAASGLARRPIDPDRFDEFRAGAQGALDRFLQRVGRPGLAEIFGLPGWRPRQSAPLRQARAMLAELVARRRASGREHGDLLDLLIAARDPETGRAMTDAEVRDNLLTFIITGSDTTALALTWSVYVLSQSAEWAARLRAEADDAWEGSGFATERLELTRRFLDEVLRLYPPVPMLIRKAMAADAIAGARVRRGDLIFAPIYTLHRHPAVWDDPHRFDPDRFAGGTPRASFTYLPFGAGPRACVGAAFAMAEAQITLASLARTLDFSPAPGHAVRPVMMITLKPEGGLPVLVRRRQEVG